MQTPIEIRESAAIGIHALILLNQAERALTSQAIAEALNVSRVYVQKTMLRLRDAGFIDTIPGKSGGYILTCDAKGTSALRIFEALSGKYQCRGCLFEKVKCSLEKCPFRDVMRACDEQLKTVLAQTMIADFK